MRQFEEARGTKPFCTQSGQPFPPNIRLGILGTINQLAGMLSTQAGYGSPLTTLATTLDGRLVLNKTGIPDADVFDIALEYGADREAWVEMQQMGFLPLTFNDPLGPTIFEALGKLGLTLEPSKGSREFIVIDSIERPAPN